MSAIKRHIEDRCEEIAVKVGLNPDDVMDIFNIINEHHSRVLHLYTDAELWAMIERECDRHAEFLRSRGVGSIKTGYIPVEYNHYKELVEKAKKYDTLTKENTPFGPQHLTEIESMLSEELEEYGQCTLADVYGYLDYCPTYDLYMKAASIIITKKEKKGMNEINNTANLIVNMVFGKATDEEFKRAINHSRNAIDAKRNGTDCKQSRIDNGIDELVNKYFSE